MKTVLVRKSDGIVHEVLSGHPLSPFAEAAEPAYFGQFHAPGWDETASAPPQPGDSFDVNSNTYTKSAARVQREADDAAEPQRRTAASAVLSALHQIAQSSGTLTAAQLSDTVRACSRALIYLVMRREREDRTP